MNCMGLSLLGAHIQETAGELNAGNAIWKIIADTDSGLGVYVMSRYKYALCKTCSIYIAVLVHVLRFLLP